MLTVKEEEVEVELSSSFFFLLHPDFKCAPLHHRLPAPG